VPQKGAKEDQKEKTK